MNTRSTLRAGKMQAGDNLAAQDGDDLLGLYVGPTRDDFAAGRAHASLPARIYLYQRNIESAAGVTENIARELRLTLRHELAHHFGFDDEELRRVWPQGA